LLLLFQKFAIPTISAPAERRPAQARDRTQAARRLSQVETGPFQGCIRDDSRWDSMLAATLLSLTVLPLRSLGVWPSAGSGRSNQPGGPPPPSSWCPCRRLLAPAGGSAGARPLLLSGNRGLRMPSRPPTRRDAPCPQASLGSGARESTNWPLGDQAPLGIGPHLVVQLDQNRNPCVLSDPPQRRPGPVRLHLTNWRPLRPGSITGSVSYGRQPWGEAVNQLVVSGAGQIAPRRRQSCRTTVAGSVPADQAPFFWHQVREQACPDRLVAGGLLPLQEAA